MTNDIKKDVDSGVHSKWEKMYRKITEVIKVTKSKSERARAAALRWTMALCIASFSCVRKQHHQSI
jgi:hypothetical protein